MHNYKYATILYYYMCPLTVREGPHRLAAAAEAAEQRAAAAAAKRRDLGKALILGTLFGCFTGTKVQIVSQYLHFCTSKASKPST